MFKGACHSEASLVGLFVDHNRPIGGPSYRGNDLFICFLGGTKIMNLELFIAQQR
jgi:hypothetical protein